MGEYEDLKETEYSIDDSEAVETEGNREVVIKLWNNKGI